MTWLPLFLAALGMGGWYCERRDHRLLQERTLKLMRLSLDITAEVVALRTRVGMYVDRELGDVEVEVYVPDVIGDPDSPVDIRA